MEDAVEKGLPMRLMRIGPLGSERPVVVSDGQAFDLSPVTADIDGDYFARGGLRMTTAALAARSLRPIELGHERVGAPVARPQAVVCVGQNYPDLCTELGLPAPSDPVLFFKHPNAVVGAFDPIVIPPRAEQVDYEIELALVMGAQAAYLESDEEALACVAGVTIANDVSERSGMTSGANGQWSAGKSAPTFCPLGPSVVPLDSLAVVGDLADLRLQLHVNGELRQDASTAQMVFSVGELVRRISQFITLEPGDVVMTGTPGGVALSGRFPYLQVGDVVELEIEGLGRQRQRLVSPSTRRDHVGEPNDSAAS